MRCSVLRLTTEGFQMCVDNAERDLWPELRRVVREVPREKEAITIVVKIS